MGFLKGLGTAVCSFLLFLALTIFSIAFLLNSTILNAGFVNSQADKIDFSSIARDVIDEQISDELPQDAEFLKDVTYDLIAAEEPLIKKQLRNGIETAYDYFLNKKSTFAIDISLVEIKQSLKENIWQTAVSYLKAQLAGLTDEEVDRYVQEITAQIPEDALPTALAILPQNLRDDAINQYLKELGGRGIFASLDFGLDFLIKDQVKASFEQYFSDSINDIQDTYSIDESSFSPDTLNAIREVRKYIGYFQSAYIWLIVFMVVMAGLIFLINWDVRKASRALGITLLVFGVLDLAGVLLTKTLRPEQFAPDYATIPVAMQNWIEGLIQDVTGIMLLFSIGVLAVGVILMVISFIVKPREVFE